MTTPILTREDTGEFLPVRVTAEMEPADRSPEYERICRVLDEWTAAERQAVDEFSAWVEGQTAQALAEMRNLCDELGLPPVFAELPEPEPATKAIGGWTPKTRAERRAADVLRELHDERKPAPAKTIAEFQGQPELADEPLLRRAWAAVKGFVLRVDAWAERLGRDET